MIVEKFHSPKAPWQIFQAVYKNSDTCFFLDSGSYNPPNQVYSYIGFNPFLKLTLDRRQCRTEGEEKGSWPAKNFLPVMRRLFRKCKMPSSQPFFCGGAVGFLGYESADLFEKIRFRKKTASNVP